MLSSQTKDEVTDAAVSKLRTALGGSLSIQNMIDANDEVIAEAIAKVGFWRRKTEFVAFLHSIPFLFYFSSHPFPEADINLRTDI
jgi:endonuclease III